MLVRVKLMGVLKEKAPAGDQLELPAGSTVADALKVLDIPTKRIHVVSVNGAFERDFTRLLEVDDEMTVLAPVSGG